MKAIVLAIAALLSSSVALAKTSTPPAPMTQVAHAESELQAAIADQVAARASWDAAIAAGHPNLAGTWARRHFAAMHQVKVARARVLETRRAATRAHAVATR